MPVPLPTYSDLARLRDATGYPMVSVLLPTAPAAQPSTADVTRLDRLVREADRRVATELGDREALLVIEPLRALARDACRQPTGHALALFSGAGDRAAFRLPVTVEEAVVVDPTFATREIARALALHPPYRVLALGGGVARLFVGAGGEFAPVGADFLGLPPDVERDADRRGHLHQPERSHRRAERWDRFLRDVDTALGRPAGSPDLPLFVAAAEPLLSRFRQLAAHPVAGVVRGNHVRTPPGRLAAAVRPRIEAHLDELRRRDLARLVSAADRGRARCEVDDVWRAARDGTVQLLLVEERFRYPARLSVDGRDLEPAGDVRAPDVLDDAVDEIIEMVARRGGRVRFVRPDDLTTGIAALTGQLRRSRTTCASSMRT